MYLIFNKDMKYIGFTDDEDLLSKFLNQRKNKKFIVQNVKKKKLNDSLKKDLFDKQRKLTIMDPINNIVGFKYEDRDLSSFLMDMSMNCKFDLDELTKRLKYCVLNGDEEETILTMIKSLDEKITQLLLMDDVEIFNIDYIMEKCNWEVYPTYPIED